MLVRQPALTDPWWHGRRSQCENFVWRKCKKLSWTYAAVFPALGMRSPSTIHTREPPMGIGCGKLPHKPLDHFPQGPYASDPRGRRT